MVTEDAVDEFVERNLQGCGRTFQNVENMYAGDGDESKNIVGNVKLYLKRMLKENPAYLIVGEAPGYKGCRHSGVPFTSERNLLQTDFFREQGGYRVRNPKKPESEASATIVWNFLCPPDGGKRKPVPLIWNAFPFHPYDPAKVTKNGTKSNRKPNAEELSFGKGILEALIKLYGFGAKNVVAVGKTAEAVLEKIFPGEIIFEVPHPANGHKADFEEGLSNFILSLNLSV